MTDINRAIIDLGPGPRADRAELLPRGALGRRTIAIFSSLLALLAASCEDVIDVDLERLEPKLVIEGVLEYDSYPRFMITRTVDFYDTYPRGEGVSGAVVVLSDDLGHTEILEDVGSGIYVVDYEQRWENSPGRTYRASVTVDGKTYEALTTMPEEIRIDSLRGEYQEGGGVGPEEDEGYRLHVFFTDPPDRPDYARLIPYNDKNYYLYNGRYSDGNVVEYDYFFHAYPQGWRLVELRTMDRVMYDYFQTLAEVWIYNEVTDFTDATPANPNTNWSGGALGYFGAFNATYLRVYLGEE